MTQLRPEVAGYLALTCPGARVSPIVGDASARRFFRVHLADGQSRVLMDYGSAFEGETDDIRLARIFHDAELRVAKILAASPPAGCLLLEDLGQVTLERALIDTEGLRPGARDLIARAVKLAARIAVDGSVALREIQRSEPALDEQRFRFEMDFFLEHYVQGLRRCDEEPRGLRDALHALAKHAAGGRRVLCHRDYHSRNLMLLEGGELAMVDIQDARWGPDSYDLASLLRDAYVEIDEEWIDPMIGLYLSLLGEPLPAAEFRSRFDVVSAQRMIKALGTFGYQIGVRKEPRYADAASRTSRRLHRLLPTREETGPLYALLNEAGLLEEAV